MTASRLLLFSHRLLSYRTGHISPVRCYSTSGSSEPVTRNGADGRAARQYHPSLQSNARTSPCHDSESPMQSPLAHHEMPVPNHRSGALPQHYFSHLALVTCHRLPDGIYSVDVDVFKVLETSSGYSSSLSDLDTSA